MITQKTDIAIIGAGPVGLMSAYLAHLSNLNVIIVDKSDGPLEVGRADALNARTLQLLELAGLFDELYPIGKPCNTSSVWKDGKFISRQSSWWNKLEGCFHKHFLMIGQSYIEKLLDQKLKNLNKAVRRSITVDNITCDDSFSYVTLSNKEKIQCKYIIGSDGSQSFIRKHFKIPFNIIKPNIIWAVIDGIIDTTFNKVPEIIVFQNETSDVAWIPREGEIDRFYVRMDTKDFSFKEALEKINKAMRPYSLTFKVVKWFSTFSVKESVAEAFSVKNHVFLAGDSCHVHSVNGGQGLNTGLSDAFNLIWKINMVENYRFPKNIFSSYEQERKPVAQSVIDSSGELVRSTKFSKTGTHAEDYVKIVEKRSDNITGMGISYGDHPIKGTRLFDFEVFHQKTKSRIYSVLDYQKFTLLLFPSSKKDYKSIQNIPNYINVIFINESKVERNDKVTYWTKNSTYKNQAVLVRPDSYIEDITPLDQVQSLLKNWPIVNF